MQAKDTKISFNGQNVYLGIDTHLKNWKVTVLLENSVFKTFSQDPCAEVLKKFLRKNFPEATYYSAYEASFCGYSIHRELEKEGIKSIVVNPADIPTTDKERKQKEDKRDSRKIAKSLRSGDLQGIYIPTIQTMEFRTMVRLRKTLVKEVNRNKSRVKFFLYFNGVKIPPELENTSKHWSARYTKWLKELSFASKFGNKTLDMLIEITTFYRQKLLEVTRELRSIQEESEYGKKIKLLLSVPGIGIITALTLLSEIEDINRFKNLDALCSYVGLVPSTNSSGEKELIGDITPRANKPLRGVIIESAWVAVRNDPSLALKYNQLCQKMKPSKAIVRIAKKLLNRIRYVLKNEQEYVLSVN